MSLKKYLRDTDKDIIKVEAVDGGGFKMECKNPDGTEWECAYYGLITYESLRKLEGKVLTILDAVLPDKEQCKATKDIFRRTFWFDWVDNGIYKGKDGPPNGMPSVSED